MGLGDTSMHHQYRDKLSQYAFLGYRRLRFSSILHFCSFDAAHLFRWRYTRYVVFLNCDAVYLGACRAPYRCFPVSPQDLIEVTRLNGDNGSGRIEARVRSVSVSVQETRTPVNHSEGKHGGRVEKKTIRLFRHPFAINNKTVKFRSTHPRVFPRLAVERERDRALT